MQRTVVWNRSRAYCESNVEEDTTDTHGLLKEDLGSRVQEIWRETPSPKRHRYPFISMHGIDRIRLPFNGTVFLTHLPGSRHAITAGLSTRAG